MKIWKAFAKNAAEIGHLLYVFSCTHHICLSIFIITIQKFWFSKVFEKKLTLIFSNYALHLLKVTQL